MSGRDHAALDQSWFEHMRRGDFEGAWRISDRLMQERRHVCCAHWPRHEQSIWNGQSLANKRVLVRCYHGLGDTIQFIRYAPMLKAIAAEVIVWAQPELLGLLACVKGIDRLLALHDGVPEVDFDADIECMELPFYFRTTLANIPNEVPYIDLTAKRCGDRQRVAVGLVWKAGAWDDARSIPQGMVEDFVRSFVSIDWVLLQQGKGVAAVARRCGCRVSQSADVRQTAAVMRGLDLVISVDSMPAHLAGALGVPVWTLLRRHADWRWMERREDSPWYPTMRLFRQRREGDWDSALAGVRKLLLELEACKAATVTRMSAWPLRRSRLSKSSPRNTPSV